MATGGVKTRPHLLVVGGQFDVLRGGPYALCCHLLSKLHAHMDISILGHCAMEQLSDEDKHFINLIDNYLEPELDDDGGGDSKVLEDYTAVLTKWEEYFPDLHLSALDITHVLVVNPHGIVSLADSMLVDSLTEESPPRVAVLNYLSPQATHQDLQDITELDLLGWTKKDVSFVMSVGPHMHGLWQKELDKAAELVSIDRQHYNISPLTPLKLISRSSSHSENSSVYHIHTLPASSPTFLSTLAPALCHVASCLQQQNKSLLWTVWTYTNDVDTTQLQSLLEQKLDLRIRRLSSFADVEAELGKSSLVIQDGLLSAYGGYCGVETLMCGVPTLLPNNPSQLSGLLLSINSPKASYFILPEEAEKWCQKILQLLADGQKATEHATDLAQVIESHNNIALKAFAGWLGVPDAVSCVTPSPPPAPSPPLTPPLRPLLRRKDFSLDKTRKLGAGGFGEVYIGQYQQKEVAVKYVGIPKDKLNIMFNEIYLLMSLQHENIVTVHGICLDDAAAYVVMEKLPANMAEKIKLNLGEKDPDKQLSDDTKVRVALGCIEALIYIHAQHVVHQDIKGQNIMLTSDLIPKLCDFGLARVKASASGVTSTDTGNACTLLYCAPEVLEAGYRPQKYSDVWSMACTLLEWFSRRGKLWKARQARSVKIEIMETDCDASKPPFGLQHVKPDWVQQILTTCFRKSALRPTAEDLKKSFQDQEAPQAVEAHCHHSDNQGPGNQLNQGPGNQLNQVPGNRLNQGPGNHLNQGLYQGPMAPLSYGQMYQGQMYQGQMMQQPPMQQVPMNVANPWLNQTPPHFNQYQQQYPMSGNQYMGNQWLPNTPPQPGYTGQMHGQNIYQAPNYGQHTNQVPINQAPGNQAPGNPLIPAGVQDMSSTGSQPSSTPPKQVYSGQQDSGVAESDHSSRETPLKQPVSVEDVVFEPDATPLQSVRTDDPRAPLVSQRSPYHVRNSGSNGTVELVTAPPLRSARAQPPPQRSMSSPAASTSQQSSKSQGKKSKKPQSKSDSSDSSYYNTTKGGARFSHRGLKSSFSREMEDAFKN